MSVPRSKSPSLYEAAVNLGSVPSANGEEPDEGAPAPTGSLSIVFTDIENSTAAWDEMPGPMRYANEAHDEVMRHMIQSYHAYEVKEIGDAFMVAFSSPVSALAWCLTVQNALIEAPWPAEILEKDYGKEVRDKEGNLISRGLAVRMSIHWGVPICKVNKVTRRIDYIGPMVHRAARALDVTEGGQIAVTREFLAEYKRAFAEERERESGKKKGEGEDEDADADADADAGKRAPGLIQSL